MEKIINFKTIKEYNDFNKNETLHPLISIVDLGKADPRKLSKLRYEFYTIFLKEVICGDLRYGLKNYDYQEGTLIFLGPGQIIGENGNDFYQPQGTALVFHSELIYGTTLAKEINNYSFFSYSASEALHLSDQERKTILDCLDKIQIELTHSIDKHSKKLIVSNIELFLDYCQRFYDRQFITRENVNKGIIEKFENLLDEYFNSDSPQENGFPTVAFCAEQLNLSSNYFGDLIKRETGKSPQEYIQNKIVELAKQKIFDSEKNINEIAFELGFKYPQHFSRFFKKTIGKTPGEYRNANLN